MGTQTSAIASKNTPLPTDTSAYKILMAANEVYRINPVLPLPLGDIANRANFSRSLIYSHFPEQTNLIHGLLTHHIRLLSQAFEQAVNTDGSFEDTAIAVGELLLSHYLEHGLILALAPQDDFISRQLPDDYIRFSRTNMRQLGKKIITEFEFTPRQTLAIILLLSVIPEQTARLVQTKQISREIGFSSLRSALKISTKTFAKGVNRDY